MEGNSNTTGPGRTSPSLEMSARRRYAVTAGVLVGMFIAALEATIVGTAMPTVIASLGGISQYSWVFTAYLVTSTVTVPVWGKLSDLYGRRLIYQIGIGLFLLGTLLSGLSDSMTQLIIFRAIQGLGAGALIPLGMTIIGDIYTVQQRARMQAIFSGVWGLSSVIGPVIGGFITDQISWRWVFWVNLPIGVLAALIIGLSLKEPKLERKPTIDYAGAALLTAGISLLMLAMVEGGTSLAALFSPLNISLLAAAVVLIILFVRVEQRAADPVIPFRLFRNRTILVAIIAGFLAGVSMFGAISYVPLFAQGTLGMTATEAGSLLTPLMLSWVTMSVIGGRVLLRSGYRSISLVGFALLTLGFVMLAMFQRETPVFWLYLDLILIGAGLGLTMLTLLIAVQEAADRSELGVATSMNQFSRAIGGAFGVAIMGVLLTSGLATQLNKVANTEGSTLTVEQAADLASNPNALIDPTEKARIPAETLNVLQNAMAAAIHPLFWLGAAAAGLAFVVATMLPRSGFEDEVHATDGDCGERMLMAQQTVINARNQPYADLDDPASPETTG